MTHASAFVSFNALKMNVSQFHNEKDPIGIAIVLEGGIVLRDISRMADAFLLMFSLIYALHLDYPKELTHTFKFIQKVLLGLEDSKPLGPRLLSLKNDLLIKE
uniref:Uncharacterized protein n=1 Tax=Sinocyclocheilus rhinocerous TaxID=307959 RepID=A0A673I231_9TELE